MTKAPIRHIDIDLADQIVRISEKLTTYRHQKIGAMPVLAKIYDQHIKVLETQLARLSK